MCSSEANVGLGVIAAGVAVLSIVAGKYAAIELLLAKEMGESPVTSITANDMIVSHADAVVGEWGAAGKEVAWPEGMTIEEAVQEADYDPAVWSEAKARWEAVDPAGQQQQIADRQRQQEEALDEFTNLIRVEAFKASFGALDVVFFLLAFATAFKVGSGMGQS